MAERIKLGGLWLNKTRDGREYLSGRLSPTVKILIFKNDFKTAENQPTHVMYLAPIEQQDEGARGAGGDSFFGDAAERDDESPEGRPTPERGAPERGAPERPAPERPAPPRAAGRPSGGAEQPPRRPPAGRSAPRQEPDELSDLDDPFAE